MASKPVSATITRSSSTKKLLTDMLRAQGDIPVLSGRTPKTRAMQLADMMWQFVLDGEINFPSGVTIVAETDQWLTTAFRLLETLDGKPGFRKDTADDLFAVWQASITATEDSTKLLTETPVGELRQDVDSLMAAFDEAEPAEVEIPGPNQTIDLGLN